MNEGVRTVPIRASTDYEVSIGRKLLSGCGEIISKKVPPCRAAVVSDDTVDALYGDAVEKSLQTAGFDVCRYTFLHGEQSKNMVTLTGLLEFLAKNGLTRTDAVIALGGGVAGDLCGFAAGVYLRGINLIQMPTTLLAAVDSSVGGKTAVNLGAGKNLAGVFKQPRAVICDCDTFDTLPGEVFADGAAEAVKYGVLASPRLFSIFEDGAASREKLADIVASCVEIKGSYVARDEFDTGARRFLNLGHTIGHAIEKASGYEVSHGQAVSIGMAAAARISEKLQIAEPGIANRIETVLLRSGLPVKTNYSAAELIGFALSDKKRSADDLSIILPVSIGECVIYDTPVSRFEELLAEGVGS